MTAVTLALRSVRVARGGRCLLALDALELPPRGFLGVLGPNGAGKTTLLEVICGLRQPTAGEVLWGGLDLCRIGAWQKTELRRQVGYVPQSQEVRGDLPLTLAEVVLTGRVGPRGLLRPLQQADRAAADRWIERLGLTAQRRQTFRSLSGGEQRKVMIARAMAADPQLLLLDEPCSNLDPAWKRRLSAIIDDIFETSGIQVVMVSHELAYLPRTMTDLLLLRAGAPVFQGPPEEGLSEPVLRRAFGEDADMPLRAPPRAAAAGASD